MLTSIHGKAAVLPPEWIVTTCLICFSGCRMELQREIAKLKGAKKDKSASSAGSSSNAGGSGRAGMNPEDADMLEMTLGMLRCSVCKDRFKSCAITRYVLLTVLWRAALASNSALRCSLPVFGAVHTLPPLLFGAAGLPPVPHHHGPLLTISVQYRCFHLFCKECIDENLRNRSRKCPACGEKFGQDDVTPVYFN